MSAPTPDADADLVLDVLNGYIGGDRDFSRVASAILSVLRARGRLVEATPKLMTIAEAKKVARDQAKRAERRRQEVRDAEAEAPAPAAAPGAADQLRSALIAALPAVRFAAKNAPMPEPAKRILAEVEAALAAASPAEAGGGYDLVAHLHRQRAFSERTFGPGCRVAGVLDHIRKELREIEADPSDLSEWIDVVLLAFDGAWRHGHTPEAIAAGLAAKQTKNEGRTWPDWRSAPTDRAIEHDRTLPAPAQAGGYTRDRVLADALRARDEAWNEIEGLRAALTELVATVRGECPSILNEDSGGSAVLVKLIGEALTAPRSPAPAQAGEGAA